MAGEETEGLDDLIYLSNSCNHSRVSPEEAGKSRAVVAFLQLEREKVIAKLRRIEELLGRRRIRCETIDIPAAISQPFYTEEGFGLRCVPQCPTLKPRPRPPLSGLQIPSPKKPYFGLKSKWTKQTIHEACKQQLPKLRTPHGGHLCQPLCDGCLHSFIVLYLGLETDKRHIAETATGYPSLWSKDLSEQLRHSLPRRSCGSCAMRNPPPPDAAVTEKRGGRSRKQHSISEVNVPHSADPKPHTKSLRGVRGARMTPKQRAPLVTDAPDLTLLNESMSNVFQGAQRAKGKMDPIAEVGRINMTATPAAKDASNATCSQDEHQLQIANCVIRSMSIDSAVFKSAHLNNVTLERLKQSLDGDSHEGKIETPVSEDNNVQQKPDYTLCNPEDFATPCRDTEHVLIADDRSMSFENKIKSNASCSELPRISSFLRFDRTSTSEAPHQRLASTRRPPFHISVTDVSRDNDDKKNVSLNNKQQGNLATPILLPRNKQAELEALVEGFKGDQDLEIDLRIIIDGEENISLEVDKVRYRPSEEEEEEAQKKKKKKKKQQLVLSSDNSD